MKQPLLLLVDLQNDFLEAPGLDPCAGELIESAGRLLAGARRLGIPIAHVVTSIDPDRDDRMPHWKARGVRKCVRGTRGHEIPRPLTPEAGEPVVAKTDFSAFSSDAFDSLLANLGTHTLIVAGVHLHGCVRATILDAYARRLEVWVAEDAVGSDDPIHGALTLRYLESRAACFLPVEAILARLETAPDLSTDSAESLPAAVIAGRESSAAGYGAMLHRSPRQLEHALFRVPLAGDGLACEAATAALRAQRGWARSPMDRRRTILARLAQVLEREASALAASMACEVGKPLAMGQAEALRGAALVRAAAARPVPQRRRCAPDSIARRRPIGIIAAVTPWNNPVAIPVGKIAAALFYGNGVVWKPAPAGARIALRLLRLLEESGVPEGLVNLVTGDARTARAVLRAPAVSAASFSGSSRGGYSVQEACSSRRIPLQAELGGNNAAIVWDGAETSSAASLVARGAFGFAGQRCTANRRVIVRSNLYPQFLEEVTDAARRMAWGDPLDRQVEAGPLISPSARRRTAAAVARASAGSAQVRVCGDRALFDSLAEVGSYHEPAIVADPDAESEIVREETFGPVLVVQPARDFDRALELLNGVSQGLVAALFGGSAAQRRRFLEEAQAGVLKLDRATSEADVHAPFGGWKSSGLGPPERGEGDREFFTREQAIYGSAAAGAATRR